MGVAPICGHAEKLCPCIYKRDASGRTRTAENRKGLKHRGASARHHNPPLWIGVDGGDADLVPIGFEFVSEDTRERRAHMLAHLGADNIDGYDSVAADGVPDSWIERASH